MKLPTYKRQSKIVFIPQENELDQLVSGSKHQLATFLQALKETASRFGELLQVEWKDLDTEAMKIAINHPEKGSNARQVKISQKLLLMINQLPRTHKTIFSYTDKDSLRKNFQRARKRIAKNVENPRLLQIHFHTFRHWKATHELKKNHNLWNVAKLLGHKDLKNTQIYVATLGELSDEWIGEVATTKEERLKLINDGWQFVEMDKDGNSYYRKAK